MRAKTIAEVTSAIGGIVGLVENLVELWQSLPFGPGPEISNDYEYLAEEVDLPWSSPRSRYTPVKRNVSSVNWALARSIYDRAHSLLLSPPTAPHGQGRDIAVLGMDADELINSLPPELQRMFAEKVGESGEPHA